MLTLMQLIARMIHLEYTEAEIRVIASDLVRGDGDFETLFNALNLEMPDPNGAVMKRLEQILEQPNKVESAIQVSLMRGGLA